MNSKRVTFFDVDETLLVCNSGPVYARWLHRQGLFSTLDLLRALSFAIQYRLNVLDHTSFYRKIASRLEGRAQAEEDERARRFFDEELKSRFRASICAELKARQDAGEAVVILSASTGSIVRPIAEMLGVKEILCTELEVDSAGLFTGQLAGQPRYGEGKRVAAEAWCAAHEYKMEEAAAFADSLSDLPLLEAVGEAVVVGPGMRLRRLARKRGWRVVDDGTDAGTLVESAAASSDTLGAGRQASD